MERPQRCNSCFRVIVYTDVYVRRLASEYCERSIIDHFETECLHLVDQGEEEDLYWNGDPIFVLDPRALG